MISPPSVRPGNPSVMPCSPLTNAGKISTHASGAPSLPNRGASFLRLSDDRMKPMASTVNCALLDILSLLQRHGSELESGMNSLRLVACGLPLLVSYIDHHGMTLRSRRNFPIKSCGASSASQMAVSAPCETSRSAFAPPMPLLIHPGHIELPAIDPRNSAARIPGTAFNDPLEMR